MTPVLTTIALYITIVAVPLVYGFLPSTRKKPVPERLRTLRGLSSIMFLGAIGAQIVAPQLFDLGTVLQISIGRAFTFVPGIVLSILDFLLLYALAVLIPGQVFGKRWRGSGASPLRTIGGGLARMLGRVVTWMLLYLAFDIIGVFAASWWAGALLRLGAATLILGASTLVGYARFLFGRRPKEEAPQMSRAAELVRSLGEKAGVAVRRVLFLETRDTRVANAMALGGRSGFVGITTYLLEHLSPDQLKFTIAHELGHLRMRHTLVRFLVSVVSVTVAISIVSRLGLYGADPVTRLFGFGLRFAIIIVTVQVIPYALYRRQELAADAFAVSLTGDARAAAESLAIVSALNHTDTRSGAAGPLGSTHPDTARRIAALQEHAE
jgi:Zn-dependent protease with chaperone function